MSVRPDDARQPRRAPTVRRPHGEPSRMAAVWRLAMATSLMCLAFGMTAPLLAVLLQQQGHDTAVVGAFAMVPLLMVALLIPLIPRLLARWGVLRVYRWGSVMQLVAAVGFAGGSGLWAWTAASVVAGIAVAGLWNGTEALLAREAPPEQRGRVMGLYQTAMGAAFALGPFLPGLLGLDARLLLMLGAALVAACCAIAFTIREHEVREPPSAQGSTWQALRLVPALAVLAFIGGVFEAGQSSVGAAYAAAGGAGLSVAASVAGVIGVGSFLCQYPAGMAADRLPARALFSTAALLLLAASAGFALADQVPWVLWASGLVWGGVGGAVYTLTMVQVAHTFEGRATAGAAAAMITGYTLGGTVGPVFSGAALAWGGAPALSALLCLAAGGALLAAQRPVARRA